MKKKIREIAKLSRGVNTTRFRSNNEDGVELYDQQSFNYDSEFYEEHNVVSNKQIEDDKYLNKGDIVISNLTQKAVIVSSTNQGKIITANFTKVELKINLNKGYFIYLYNNSSNVQKQKQQNTLDSGVIQILNNKSMENIEIDIVDEELQEQIGVAYLTTRKLMTNLNKSAELVEKLTNTIIENKI
ncbi:MAG: restriction endonuclease subunit S [Bacilli bacterium]